jgi:sporulation protein YlmC with PRC-barrel domain
MKHLSIAIGAACVCMSTATLSQEAGISDLPRYQPGPEVRNGFSAQELRGAEVRGKDGQTIGEVEELIVGPDAQLRRLIVSVNESFLGFGGRMLAVDWDDVSVQGSGFDVDYLNVPVTKQNVEEHGIFEDKQASAEGKQREWRASELIGDYVNLEDVEDYGSVADLVFDREGQLQMISAAPDFGRSLNRSFLAPYDTVDGWDPGEEYYVLPYKESELRKLLPPKSAASQMSERDSG